MVEVQFRRPQEKVQMTEVGPKSIGFQHGFAEDTIVGLAAGNISRMNTGHILSQEEFEASNWKKAGMEYRNDFTDEDYLNKLRHDDLMATFSDSYDKWSWWQKAQYLGGRLSAQFAEPTNYIGPGGVAKGLAFGAKGTAAGLKAMRAMEAARKITAKGENIVEGAKHLSRFQRMGAWAGLSAAPDVIMGAPLPEVGSLREERYHDLNPEGNALKDTAIAAGFSAVLGGVLGGLGRSSRKKVMDELGLSDTKATEGATPLYDSTAAVEKVRANANVATAAKVRKSRIEKILGKDVDNKMSELSIDEQSRINVLRNQADETLASTGNVEEYNTALREIYQNVLDDSEIDNLVTKQTGVTPRATETNLFRDADGNLLRYDNETFWYVNREHPLHGGPIRQSSDKWVQESPGKFVMKKHVQDPLKKTAKVDGVEKVVGTSRAVRVYDPVSITDADAVPAPQTPSMSPNEIETLNQALEQTDVNLKHSNQDTIKQLKEIAEYDDPDTAVELAVNVFDKAEFDDAMEKLNINGVDYDETKRLVNEREVYIAELEARKVNDVVNKVNEGLSIKANEVDDIVDIVSPDQTIRVGESEPITVKEFVEKRANAEKTLKAEMDANDLYKQPPYKPEKVSGFDQAPPHIKEVVAARKNAWQEMAKCMLSF